MSADVDALGVSRETAEELGHLVELVRKWNQSINLVSAISLADIWQRHVADSLQLFEFAAHSGGSWVDLGSGAGFPGLVVAIASKKSFHTTLIESDQRKSLFINNVIRDLSLHAEVIAQRIETCSPQAGNIVSARALAPLPKLLSYAHRHAAPGARLLFLKGARVGQELTAARQSWHMNVTKHPSRTDPGGCILEIESLAHA